MRAAVEVQPVQAVVAAAAAAAVVEAVAAAAAAAAAAAEAVAAAAAVVEAVAAAAGAGRTSRIMKLSSSNKIRPEPSSSTRRKSLNHERAAGSAAKRAVSCSTPFSCCDSCSTSSAVAGCTPSKRVSLPVSCRVSSTPARASSALRLADLSRHVI